VYNGNHHTKTSREAEKKQRICKSCSNTGINNPAYGKPSWSTGKKRPDHSQWLKENNPMFNHQYRDNYFLAQFGKTAEQWANTKDERYLYILDVLRITKKQPLHTLENFDKIGRIENGGYAVDHIYSKSKGFDNNIPAELIGDIRNLQIIPGIINIKKREHIIYVPKHIQDYLDNI
jgi:hypothetical protein